MHTSSPWILCQADCPFAANWRLNTYSGSKKEVGLAWFGHVWILFWPLPGSAAHVARAAFGSRSFVEPLEGAGERVMIWQAGKVAQQFL